MIAVFAAALALSIADGDTLTLRGEKYRLHGIDAPELAQLCRHPNGYPFHCGAAALLHLDDLVAGRPIRCAPAEPGRDRDRYGRRLGICYAGDDRVSLNQRMVEDGFAAAYRAYSFAYVAAESDARLAKRGLWAGSFEAPWTWRHSRPR